MRFVRSSSCLSCFDAVTLDPASHGKNETTACCKTHADDDDDERTCVVCFKETLDVVFPCQHVMCGVCAARWCSKQARCAVCRQHVYGSSATTANHDVILINGPRQKHKLQLPKQYTKRIVTFDDAAISAASTRTEITAQRAGVVVGLRRFQIRAAPAVQQRQQTNSPLTPRAAASAPTDTPNDAEGGVQQHDDTQLGEGDDEARVAMPAPRAVATRERTVIDTSDVSSVAFVVVEKASLAGLFHRHGIVKGTIVLSFNGIPCQTPECVDSMITCAEQHGVLNKAVLLVASHSLCRPALPRWKRLFLH